ncbi:DUF917 domain-containing protein [Streptomyces sp. NPDC048425]|uniref:DUF917 domain-containing protein n=1 Tax=Streptomyces sp. NPDC048425 TaxID=3365548 RepID=UPI00371BA585
MNELGLDALESLAEGSRILASGIEESAFHVALDWARAELAQRGPVRLLAPQDLDGLGLCVTITFMGSSAAVAEQLPTGDEPLRAIRALERMLGRRAEAVVGLNTAAENALLSVVTAATCGLPLADGDGCGRVLPLLEQTVFTLGGVSAAPLAVTTASGDDVAVESARDRVEDLLRPMILAAGGWAVVAGYAMDGPTLARHIVPNTVSRAAAAGMLSGPRRHAPWQPKRLCRGTISALEHADDVPRRPASGSLPSRPTSVVVTEDEGLRRRFRLEAHNEVLLALADGAIAAAAPDQILMLTGDGHVMDVDRAAVGARVDVVVLRAAPAWQTPEGHALARTGGPTTALDPAQEESW